MTLMDTLTLTQERQLRQELSELWAMHRADRAYIIMLKAALHDAVQGANQ